MFLKRSLPTTNHPLTNGQHGHIVAVWGPGGSPGTSTIAAGIAARVARYLPEKVALVDGDLTHGGLTRLLRVSPGRTLGSALLLPHGENEPCAPDHIEVTSWGTHLIPGVAGPGAPVDINLGDYTTMLERLATHYPVVIIDVGDELPPRQHGELHAVALERAHLVIVVGAGTAKGEHDLLLEYRLLDELLRSRNPLVERWSIVNHMQDGDILSWRRRLEHDLKLNFISQIPHDWGTLNRAWRKRVPLPLTDPHATASKALDRVGERVLSFLSAQTEKPSITSQIVCAE